VTGGKHNKLRRQPQKHDDEEMFLDFAEDYLPIVPVALKELKLIDHYIAELDKQEHQYKLTLKIKEDIERLK
jgi:hypothetical protein